MKRFTWVRAIVLGLAVTTAPVGANSDDRSVTAAATGLFAVQDLVAPLSGAGVRVDVDVSGDAEASDASVALVWRLAQECVRNVARHARADRMSLTVRHEGDRLLLEVVDDGVGFDPATVESDDHFGLRAAGSLVREHGGTWEVDSAPGSGTMVRVEVPVG